MASELTPLLITEPTEQVSTSLVSLASLSSWADETDPEEKSLENQIKTLEQTVKRMLWDLQSVKDVHDRVDKIFEARLTKLESTAFQMNYHQARNNNNNFHHQNNRNNRPNSAGVQPAGNQAPRVNYWKQRQLHQQQQQGDSQ